MDATSNMLPPTEFAAGESLASRLTRETRLPLGVIVRIGRDIALELAHIHERGQRHGALGPGNVWLERDSGRVRVFGFRTDADPTVHGPVSGDIHNLGVILYQMCTGETPAETPIEPFWLNEKITSSVSNLIMLLLGDERPKTAQDVVDALEAIAADVPEARIHVARAAPVSMGSGLQSDLLDDTETSTRPRVAAWAQRSFLAGAVLIAAVTGAMVLRPWRQPPAVVPPREPATVFDRLSPKMLTPIQLRHAGGGHADQAPAELVEMLGDGRFRNPGLGGDLDFNALAVSPDGLRFAASHGDLAVRIFDAETGELLRSCPMTSAVTRLAYAPDGRTLFAIRKDGALVALDPETGAAVPHMFPHASVSAIDFSRGGAVALVSGASGKHHVWNVRAKRELFPFVGPCVLHPDGDKLLYLKDNLLWLWDIAKNRDFDRLDGRDEFGLPREPCTFRFSPDGKMLFLGYAKKTICYWFERRAFEHTEPVGSLDAQIEFSSDSRHAVATTSAHVLHLWDLQSGELKKKIPSNGIHRAVFVPRQFKIAVLDSTDRIRLTNFDGQFDREFDREPDPRPSLHWFAVLDDSLITYSSSDMIYRSFNLKTHTSRGLFQGVPQTNIELTADGTKMFAGSGEIVNVHDFKTLGISQLTTSHRATRSKSLAVSPDGRHLTLGSADGVTLWDLIAGKQTTFPRSASLQTMTNQVLIAADDGPGVRPVVAWELATNRRLWSHDHAPVDLRASPDGKLVAAAQHEETLVLDAATGVAFAKLPPALRVVFSPDSRQLAMVSATHLSVWAARPGPGERLAHIPLGTDKSVAAITFSPEGRHVVLGYGSGVIAIFRLS